MAKTLLVELGEPLKTELKAFCEAHYDSSRVRVIREALQVFIKDRLDAEPEMARRYDLALARLTGDNGDNVSYLGKRHTQGRTSC